MYISGGSNVYPREAEEKILEHPAIDEAAIVGVPDADWGEVGVAVITLHEGAAFDEAAFKLWLMDKVARYKQPKSGYGEIEKKRIKAMLEEQGLIDFSG